MKTVVRMLLTALTLSIPLASASAATTVVAPGSSVTVHLDPKGKPEPFTITVAGFQPLAMVFVEQCDGTPDQNPNFKITLDCDVGTQAAGKRADANGRVTFPAADPNYGFHPVRGRSPENLFYCLAPGDAKPTDGLPVSKACTARVASNYIQPTDDQRFITMKFASGGSSGSSPWIWILVTVGLVAVAVVLVVALARRKPARSSR
jgi:hypothetical protein